MKYFLDFLGILVVWMFTVSAGLVVIMVSSLFSMKEDKLYAGSSSWSHLGELSRQGFDPLTELRRTTIPRAKKKSVGLSVSGPDSY